MKKIVVLGKGNAGVYTALHYHHKTDHQVELIYDPDTPSETVGQATFPISAQIIWETLQVDWYHNPIKSTIKTGILYKNWGEKQKEYFHPFPMNAVALHYDTQAFQQYVIDNGGFKVTKKKINNYNEIDADYVFDCRGWPKDYTNYKILKNPLNSVLLSSIKEDRPAVKWTTAQATPDGWCFVIPLLGSVSHGYLYNDSITSEEQAEKNFKEIFKVDQIFNRFKFKNYVANNPIVDDRIILNGNRLFFLEPLETTAVSTYIDWAEVSNLYIDKKISKEQSIKHLHTRIERVQNFVLYHYLHGSYYKTKFWDYCKQNYTIDDPLFWDLIDVSGKMTNKQLLLEKNDYGLHHIYSFKNMAEALDKNYKL
jgi:hypothetical protein